LLGPRRGHWRCRRQSRDECSRRCSGGGILKQVAPVCLLPSQVVGQSSASTGSSVSRSPTGETFRRDRLQVGNFHRLPGLLIEQLCCGWNVLAVFRRSVSRSSDLLRDLLGFVLAFDHGGDPDMEAISRWRRPAAALASPQVSDADQASAATSTTACAKACGASCGRLCPMPPVIFRCAYLPVNFGA
jgi:hypothetical protein